MERQQNVLSTLSYYPLSFSPLVRGREWAAIVLFTMIFVGLACEAGEDGSDEYQCEIMSTGGCYTTCGDGVCEGDETESSCFDDCIIGKCWSDVCDEGEDCGLCYNDCPCGEGMVCMNSDNEICDDGCENKEQPCLEGYSDECYPNYVSGTCKPDPLLDYYWIEGTWERDGGSYDGLLFEIEVKDWDENFGAEVWGFQPWGMVYIKKNLENGIFELNRTDEEGSWAKGTANPSTLIVKFSAYFADSNETIDVEYHKL